jgi:prolyl-tRNA synthetase
MEKAEALAPAGPRPGPTQALARTPTPGKSTCADVAQLLGVPLQATVKSLVLATDSVDAAGVVGKAQVWLLLVRGDHDMNEVKVGKVPGLDAGFRFATVPEILEHFGTKPGYLGPIGLLKPVRVVADPEVAVMANWICGANAEDFHMTGVNWGRDVFYLGTKYSHAMNASFLDETGKPQFMEMGCYGIGITRLPAAAIEQNHDERGIIWPDAIAPFTVVVCPIGMDRSEQVKAAATGLHDELSALGIDVILDDRGERPGAMFADWELIGVPHRVVISDRGLKEGQLEYQHRRDSAATQVPVAGILDHLRSRGLL